MVRSLLLLGAASLVAASPAPALLNFDIVNAAPAPSVTGPDPAAVQETGIYNAASASASAVAAVTGVATASAVTAEKRSIDSANLDKRTFCFFGFGWCGSSYSSSSSSKSSTSTAKAVSTTAYATTTATAVVTTAPATTSLATSYNVAPSSCTPVSWTNTFAFTSDTACPTPYEVGTYCGFINPEDPCAAQPDGYGPKTTPDTSDAFLVNDVYHKLAKSAAAPSGYASTFTDLNAAVNANSYMGLYTLQSYDVATCAAKCDSTSLCTAFNIYVERDPQFNPDQCSCTGNDVPSITNFKCTLWGSGVQPGAAVNTGETRSGFSVVITGSNGYEKTNNTTPVTPPGWTKPQKCSGIHDHPRTCLGEKMFKGVFDVNVCATYATAQNAINKKAGLLSTILSLFGYNPNKCNFFNAFMLTQDGVAQGTYCKLFAQQYDSKVAVSVPGWSSSHFYGVESSWSFCSS
ncbi:hypothetical protein BKA67DRAFT_145494 [Truncatella angustata]|uniref:Uncharacterized protein n=1 Tax=Truncatella angustata TaxID=152316 RepID=A0A9P8UAL9_9PEZI|nr:uncharacterized protein BKA67DRAFT_145494 [Truncatella angustata]KAH6638633.1 hypothetical protein BKA67DRAFT_145494 [Truncatella angustata]KAH8196999.1 hypothetical protein TruAng_008819 [Truncatella angustata]